MASDDPGHQRSYTSPQSIPLQDLNRGPYDPQDEFSEPSTSSYPHRRTLSDRGRRLFSRGGSRNLNSGSEGISRRQSNQRNSRYSQLDDAFSPAFTHGMRQVSEEDNDTYGEVSPVESPSSHPLSYSFAGISFGEDTSYSRVGRASISSSRNTSGALGALLESNHSVTSLNDHDYEDIQLEIPDGHLAGEEDDTAPLTNSQNIQPIGRAPINGHDAVDLLSPNTKGVRFSMIEPSPTGSRLGDDLVSAEAGQRSLSMDLRRSISIARNRSTSMVESPLQRAGTMVKKMSQRVVNLSNEPEIAEKSIIRRQSQKSVRDENRARKSISTEYTHDGVDDTASSEKTSSIHTEIEHARHPLLQPNPLRGNSLRIFSPENKLRRFLCDVLVHPITEPLILLLIVAQTVLLAIDSGSDVFDDTRPEGWERSVLGPALLALFSVYTVEIIIRIIVSGFIINPIEYSTINRSIGLMEALKAKSKSLFAVHVGEASSLSFAAITSADTSLLHSLGYETGRSGSSGDNRQMARRRLAHRAYLRHSFNRLDFLAVISYWISFALAAASSSSSIHIYLFQMLSCLRILRLLNITSGTLIILRSLKKAAPLLLNVALLIGFFWLLFAIIGVQSFKSSLRRYCVWTQPNNSSNNYTLNFPGSFQFCGGSLAPNGTQMPWIYPDGTSSGISKGYLCPVNSVCQSSSNPYNGTVSFDNILQSLEQVFIIMTSNTYSDIMYYTMNSDYLVSALFFAVGIVVMTLWLVNLLVAVITSSFQIIREETKTSAFSMKPSEPAVLSETPRKRTATIKKAYDNTYWLWILVIIYGLGSACARSSHMSQQREQFISVSETIVTLILLLEIAFRFTVDWRNFFGKKSNWVDLALAIITTVIQVPVIHNSGEVYAWLTFFQIIRIYRVVLAIPWTRDLLLLVLGSVSGIMNLILFVFLLTFLAAIFASQLFRGTISGTDINGNWIHVPFTTIWNSFLGMYQLLSSENWTTVLYNVTSFDVGFGTAWYGAIFIILWMILANFIVLTMFIAVIQENFDVSEDEKRVQQVKRFLRHREFVSYGSNGTLALSSLFKLSHFKSRRQDPLDYGDALMEQLLKDQVVHEFLDDESAAKDAPLDQTPSSSSRPMSINRPNFLALWWARVRNLFSTAEENPFYSELQFSRAEEEIDPRMMVKEVASARETRKQKQREYLARHPNYDVSLFIFRPGNRIRRLCQAIVGPGRGTKRVNGRDPSVVVWYIFSAFLYAAIVAMVLLACITTPLYQLQYFNNSNAAINWYTIADLTFAAVFTVEAAIRIIADGFFWTPHAYLRSSWGFIDGIVLVTLWVNVFASFFNDGAVTRAVGAFKALRALRLLNVSNSARDTFHSVIIQGGWKVLSAAFVSLSFLIPFAIYGLNLFNGRMEACNDNQDGIYNLSDCVLEWQSTPYSNNWPIIAPRVVANSYYNFDNFGNSLFILFQIVSQEGWIDVLWSAQSITGFFTQPRAFASQAYAVFFVVFNLLGSVFVLTLFVSVFMRNYTEQTGVAFLTTEQRSWLETRKLLQQISPSKRPAADKKRGRFTKWCYMICIRKTGKWQRSYTGILLFHLILLCIDFYPSLFWWDVIRNIIFFLLTLFYIANIFIRIVGLSWSRFRKSSWDLYSLVAVGGTFVTTILYLPNFSPGQDAQHNIYQQMYKLFLVSIVLMLIPRNNQLDQLFKTAAASFGNIANLLATWFVLFLVFAIALTQTLGLTKFGPNENGNLNFRDVPKALILLFRMSTGEGWNQIMYDYSLVVPPYCTQNTNFLLSDCGSAGWARTLFVAWNILSMYIFVNMFISLIFESFSYVYQRSSGLEAINRNELRRFKEAWSVFDPDGKGFISKEKFPKLLGELSGIFEMRIYPQEFNLSHFIDECKIPNRESQLPIEGSSKPRALDLAKLNAKIAKLPIREIQQRRKRLNVFYEEVLNSADVNRGIAFTDLLMTLVLYKVINDNKSLRLEEFLRRRARLQRVEDDVRRGIVSNFLDTVHWSRWWQSIVRKRQASRMTTIPQFQVPEIYVDDGMPLSPIGGNDESAASRPQLSLQIPTISEPIDSHSVVGARGSANSPTGVGRDEWSPRPSSIQMTPNRLTFGSMLSPHGRSPSDALDANASGGPATGEDPFSDTERTDRTDHWMRRPTTQDHRSRSNSNVSARDVRDAIENSAWGESLRRSFTTKRESDEQR